MRKLHSILLCGVLLGVPVASRSGEPVDSLKSVAVSSEEFVRMPVKYILQKLEQTARSSGQELLSDFSIGIELQDVERQRIDLNLEGKNLYEAILAVAESIGAGVEFLPGKAILKDPSEVASQPEEVPPAVVPAPNEYFGEYQRVYEERMAAAKGPKEVSFLTERYDGALKKIYDQLVMSGQAGDAWAVKEERQRIRNLDAVVATEKTRPEEKVREKVAIADPRIPSVSGVDFFGIKRTCTHPVFLLMAGPAASMNRDQPERGRMTIFVALNRVAEMVDQLPAESTFNAAVFWNSNTTPVAPGMLAATTENKALFSDWASTINPPQSSGVYGSAKGPFASQLARLRWPQRLDTGIASGWPKWVYEYKPAERISKHSDEAFVHWSKALCFAFEQKADAVFIFTSNSVLGRNDPADLKDALEDIAKELYGSDRKNYPSVNVVVLNLSGGGENGLGEFKPILKSFDFAGAMVGDMRDFMTKEERVLLDSL